MNKYRIACLLAIPFLFAGWSVPDADARGTSSITYTSNHSVKRSDGTSASMNEKHEFRGGSHLYFAELDPKKKESSWMPNAITNMSTHKKGWVRLYLDWPVRISRIVIHKASVGRTSFKGGYIEMQVQGLKGRWIKVFERKDDDIDRAVTIRKTLNSVGLERQLRVAVGNDAVTIRKTLNSVGQIKGARLRFKSPAPITIGPIDIY
ncbi:MAG: hypothetical protein Q9M29_07940 [Mariprofundaceae bacterium]|nr:hypothetical protein [Mariprofundaceae bacterium]